MRTLQIEFAPHHLLFAIDGGLHSAPVGVSSLAAAITGDPPTPEDLTNAIGLVLDHLDDVERELPMAAFAEVIEISGEGAGVLVDVEVGEATPRPFVLTRSAAEEIFRTLATEQASDRALNPGLPREWVHDVLGACCAIVAIMRRLRGEVVVVQDRAQP